MFDGRGLAAIEGAIAEQLQDGSAEAYVDCDGFDRQMSGEPQVQPDVRDTPLSTQLQAYIGQWEQCAKTVEKALINHNIQHAQQLLTCIQQARGHVLHHSCQCIRSKMLTM